MILPRVDPEVASANESRSTRGTVDLYAERRQSASTHARIAWHVHGGTPSADGLFVSDGVPCLQARGPV